MDVNYDAENLGDGGRLPFSDSEISLFKAGDDIASPSAGPLTEVDGIPVLRISLFGGFQARRDGAPLDMSALNRQKVRNLLSVLTLCTGKDLNCSHLARVLWPEGLERKNTHNFYNLWSLLRQGLVLPNGTCPYVERRQNSCRLVEEYVISDVAMMGNLCNRLQFECKTVEEALATYRAIAKLYSGSLLPGEDENSIINRDRWIWQNRIVDCLNIASCCLYFRKEYTPAIWMSQAATMVDPTREDVCQTLMQSYVAVGAKAAALQAFYKLQSSVREALGVDPSDSVSDFFKAVLVDDYDIQQEIIASTAQLSTFSPLGNQTGSDLEKLNVLNKGRKLPSDVAANQLVDGMMDGEGDCGETTL